MGELGKDLFTSRPHTLDSMLRPFLSCTFCCPAPPALSLHSGERLRGRHDPCVHGPPEGSTLYPAALRPHRSPSSIRETSVKPKSQDPRTVAILACSAASNTNRVSWRRRYRYRGA
jgi:hypothetical protein